jgi:hypothetical protein
VNGIRPTTTLSHFLMRLLLVNNKKAVGIAAVVVVVDIVDIVGVGLWMIMGGDRCLAVILLRTTYFLF